MRHQIAGADFVVLPNSTAFAMCDGLIRMSHCLIVELPEDELREIRYRLDSLLMKADLALDLMGRKVSLDFKGLAMDPRKSPVLFSILSDIFQVPAPTLPLGPKTLARTLGRPTSG